jgi:hypothetical protein
MNILTKLVLHCRAIPCRWHSLTATHIKGKVQYEIPQKGSSVELVAY